MPNVVETARKRAVLFTDVVSHLTRYRIALVALADLECRQETASGLPMWTTSISRLITLNSNSGSMLTMLMRGGSTFVGSMNRQQRRFPEV